MGKIYAVRKGKKPGKYYSWDECKKQVLGFKNAEYSSFETEKEADAFLNAEMNNLDETDISSLETYAFVDGSFNESKKMYGYGGFLIHKGKKIILQGSGQDEDMATMRNIAGEILGSKAAIEKALYMGLKEITIFYDYMGIEMWANGLWKRNKKGTEAYYEYVQSVKDKVKIHFVKVKGHTGIEGNEEADKLAKQSVGIEV